MNNRGHDYMDVGGRITSGTVIETNQGVRLHDFMTSGLIYEFSKSLTPLFLFSSFRVAAKCKCSITRPDPETV